ncbi:MAG: hypothetical protein R3222_08255 [Balneolaceae bacterium]|nr:hypothetical protein [Balneolaceae bacterium]
MDGINQIPLNIDPGIGMIVGVMVLGSWSLQISGSDMKKLLRVIKRPKAPIIGLVTQFGILPAHCLFGRSVPKFYTHNKIVTNRVFR